MGADFGQVRIHADDRAAASAKAVDGVAYTVGRHVAFARGARAPGTAKGERLLAHELAHVAQQRRGGQPSPASLGLSCPDAPAEREAEAAASSAVRGDAAAPLSSRPPVLARQVSSSSSSGGGGGGAPDGGASVPGANCKVDVRATHIGGILSGLPIWHLFIVVTDGVGTETYYRGGPGGSCPGVTPSTYGTIATNNGPYVAGTVDWSPGAPSTTVLSGPTACPKGTCFEGELRRINGTCTPYAATGPNSNTVVSTLLNKCTVPRGKPVAIAPGWGDPDL